MTEEQEQKLATFYRRHAVRVEIDNHLCEVRKLARSIAELHEGEELNWVSAEVRSLQNYIDCIPFVVANEVEDE